MSPTQNRATKLTSITSEESRNLVRGILANEKDIDHNEMYDRLHLSSSGRDNAIALKILSAAQTANKIRLSLPFPPVPPSNTHLEPRDALTTSAFISVQERRMERYADQLVKYVTSVCALNKAFEEYDVNRIGESLAAIVAEFGFSVHVSRKVASLFTRFEYDAAMLARLAAYRDMIATKRSLIHRSMDDHFDLARSYISARRVFIRFSDGHRLSRIVRAIVQYQFSPIYQSNEQWVERARSFAAYSLPDLLMYAIETKIIGDAGGAICDASASFKLPEKIEELYHRNRTSMIVQVLDSAKDRSPLDAQDLFRHAGAWLCDSRIAAFFAPIERYIGPRLDGKFGVVRPFFLDGSFDTNSLKMIDGDRVSARLRDLSGVFDGNDTNLKVDDFQRTILLVKSIENGVEFSNMDGEQLLTLLGMTQDVADLLSVGELDGAFCSKPDDFLYEMLRATLLFEAKNSLVSDYNLRTATEILASKRFDKNIVYLLQFIYTRSPAIAAYFIAMWNEHFLVQCYSLYKSAYQVNEARRALLEWYGQEVGDEGLMERARSLGLENKLSLIRHDIDSQRLYVDLVRFNQWMIEHLADHLRSVAVSAVTQEAPEDNVDLRDEVEVIIRPEFELARIVDAAFREFCVNKAYGIDSYVGRRIRHGTFSGTLYKGVTDVRNEMLSQIGRDAQVFEADLDAWITAFNDEVKRFARERLQIYSAQKPKGLLVPYIGTHQRQRSVRFIIEDLRQRLTDRRAIPEALDVISQSCWILLEPDLVAIQRELERWRRDKLTLNRNQFRSGLDASLDDSARSIVRRVNEQVDQLIQQIKSWFTTPKEIAPSATIQELFHVVRNEVAEQVAGFSPQVIEEAEPSIRIVGHRYQYIYDALYILVHNAALHGCEGGELTFDLKRWSDGATIWCDVAVGNELSPDAPDSRTRIEEAMNAPMDDALVTEGSTGIRKLRSLAAPRTDISDVRVSFAASRVQFAFRMTFAAVLVQ